MNPEEKCFHCGLPAYSEFSAQINGHPRSFCCPGCQAVAETISAEGLSDFYHYRDSSNVKPDTQNTDFTAFDLPRVQQDFVSVTEEGWHQARLMLPDIRCAACVWLVEKHLQKVQGVHQVSVNASSHSAQISFDASQIPVSELFQQLHSIGYTPQPLLAQSQQAFWQKTQKEDLLRMGVAGIGMMQAGMVGVALHAGTLQGIEPQWQSLLRWVSLILTAPIIFYSAVPFFKNALRALRSFHLNMDVPVSVALLLAYSASAWATVGGHGEVYFDSVAMFAFFLLLGRYLEKRARYGNIKARVHRAQLLPLTAQRLEEGARHAVPVAELKAGDLVWVKAGSVFPCDGLVQEGTSEADEAVITGESRVQTKTVGDRVIAGAHNGSSALTVRVQAAGSATELAAIERLVQQAELQRPAQVALADRLSSYFVAAVLLVAATVAMVWWQIDPSRALWVTLSVLVVTCPCALSLATPAALTCAINKLRDKGILVTGGTTLESILAVNQVIFDKTGTLTEGVMSVEQVLPLADIREAQILSLAAALEQGSAHPIARAFADTPVPVRAAATRAHEGRGVSGAVEGQQYRLGRPDFAWPGQVLAYPGQGQWLLLAGEQGPLGWICLHDNLRAGSKEAVTALAAHSNVTVLSGDREENVAQVANTLGLQDWRGGLLPADKLAYVERSQQAGNCVLMVGDGINDVPVISRADVSVVMGSATEFAQNKADCVLVADNLMLLNTLLQSARITRRIIRQNLGWAVGYNLVALPLAVAGLVPPWAAALGMSFSSLLVVLNALRAGPPRKLSSVG